MIWMIQMSHPLAKRTVRYDIFCQWSRLSGWAGMFQRGRRGKKNFLQIWPKSSRWAGNFKDGCQVQQNNGCPHGGRLSKSSGTIKKECCQDSSPSVTLGSDVGWWKKQLLPQRWGLGSEFWCAPQIQSVWRGVGGGFGGGRDGNSIKVRGELKSHLWWTYAKFWQVGGDWIANQVDTYMWLIGEGK